MTKTKLRTVETQTYNSCPKVIANDIIVCFQAEKKINFYDIEKDKIVCKSKVEISNEESDCYCITDDSLMIIDEKSDIVEMKLPFLTD